MRIIAIVLNIGSCFFFVSVLVSSLVSVAPMEAGVVLVFLFVIGLLLVNIVALWGGKDWLSLCWQRRALEEKRKMAEIQKEMEGGK